MDDRFGRLHGSWSWGHSGDDSKYYDGINIAPPMDGGSEPYVDSLHQLNKIVERILPECSTTISASIRPKSETSLRKQHQQHHLSYDLADVPRERAPPVSSMAYDSMVKKSKSSAELTGDFMHETLRVKMMRTNDSLNDSAYETFVGDGSTDAADVTDQVSKGSRNDMESSGHSPRGKVPEVESSMLSPLGSTSCDADKLSIKKETGSEGRRTARLYRQESDCGDTERLSSKAEPDGTYSDAASSGEGGRNSGNESRVRPSEWSANRRSHEISRYRDNEDYVTNADSSAQRSDNSSPGKGSQQERHVSSMNDGRLSGVVGEDDSKSFTCPHCVYSATKKGQVRKHMSVHGIFLCAHCDYSCDSAEMLEEHRRVRHPGLCGRRLCKKCRVLFQSTELDAHELQCSGEKQRWACPTCGKEFKFLSVMKAHAHKWHPPGDSDIMPSVKIKSESSPAIVVSSAVTVISPPPLVISSPVRDSSGQSTPSIVKPDSTPAEARLFQCSECGKTFKTKWTLNNHSMLHAGAETPFCCDLEGCNGAIFRSDKELNCHRASVHQLGPTKYHCSHPGCTMQFAKYGHFKRHQSTHTVASSGDSPASSTMLERKFQCDWPQCNKAFSHTDNLQVHYRRHSEEKPYRCDHCQASYRQKSGLKYHLDKVHGEKSSGRCGRKRKISTEADDGIVFAEPARKPLQSDVDNMLRGSPAQNEQTNVEFHSGDRRLNSIPGRKPKDGIGSAKFKLAAKLHQTEKLNVPGRSTSLEKGHQWTMSHGGTSQEDGKWLTRDRAVDDGCSEIDNVGLTDEWAFNDDDDEPCVSGRRLRDSGGGNAGNMGRRAEEMDQDLAGSTSDTEPLDEDLCEELRKLSDVINSGELTPPPHGISSPGSPFGSPLPGDEFCSGSLAPAGHQISTSVLHDDAVHNPSLYQGLSAPEGQEVYDQFAAPSDVTMPHRSFYSRHMSIDDMCSMPPQHVAGQQNSHLHGSQDPDNAGQFVSDVYYTRSDSVATEMNCYPEDCAPQFSSPSRTCMTSRSMHSNGSDTEAAAAHQMQFDIACQPQWSSGAANSPFWTTSRAVDNASSLSAHSQTGSNLGIPICSSAGPEYTDPSCHHDDGYGGGGGSVQNWSSSTNDDLWQQSRQQQHHDSLFRGWQSSTTGSTLQQPDGLCPVGNYGNGSNNQEASTWHMGRQGESAFTRNPSNVDPAKRYDLGHRTASPVIVPQYRFGSASLSSLQERMAERFASRFGSDVYPAGTGSVNSWTEFYGNSSAVGAGPGLYAGGPTYDSCLPTDRVYKPSSPSDRFYFESSQSGMRGEYEHATRTNTAVGYGFANNGYALPPMHGPAWPSSTGDSLRPMPGSSSQLPYQQGSVLYNVVPRYY